MSLNEGSGPSLRLKSWTQDEHIYALHTITLRSSSSATSTTIPALLHPSMIPLLPSSASTVTAIQSPCFELKQTASKGVGMFATRSISPGELIVVENPVAILPNKPLTFNCTAYDELEALILDDRRAEMLTLTNCQDRTKCPSDVEGIARTNALNIILKMPVESREWSAEERHYGGIFLKIPRCNHSCGPNAAHKWNLATMSSTLYAVRPIANGEEITNTYADPTDSRAKRMAHLQEHYGFTCDCPSCLLHSTATEQKIAQSDIARELLRTWFSLHPSFSKWLSDPCLPDDFVISSHKYALELIEQEGIQGMEGPFLEEIAMCYAVLGQKEEFSWWAKRVISRCALEDVEMVTRMQAMLKWVEEGEFQCRTKTRRPKTPKEMNKIRWGVRKRGKQQNQARPAESSCEVLDMTLLID
ncbi:hypothetical protein BDQ12DRAFT_674044 [Crucibulum laeve]|uniref:SET domain-containing protein n=1 Tax=Crucibulum laeve TaxID=68775 RepID=A0A5C3MI40_9AGAR|nr:hypothetical protein BDQ12DRAFT_674044 [Crucibulum laeve]